MMSNRFFGAFVTVALVASAAFVATPALALVAVDSAGIETRDTASSGPSPSEFVDVAVSCGAACKLTASDDQIIAVGPAAGERDWPFHWSSDVATQGVAGGTASQATVWLDTNGYIAFVQPAASTYVPAPIPSASVPDAIVAGVWTDLNPAAATTGGIYKQITGTAPNRTMYLQWKAVPDFGATCAPGYSFQFVLRESDNSVTVHYRSNTCTGVAARGGQENSAGTSGTMYFSGSSIPSNTAVRYRDVVAPDVNAPQIVCTTPGNAGWCRSATNTVTISDDRDMASQAIGLGVKTRSWQIGTQPQGAYPNGSAMSVTRPDGSGSLVARATDWAGNLGTSPQPVLQVDTTNPTISATVTPLPNASGWYSTSPTVTWTCADATSGVASCPAATTLTGEGAAVTASAAASDVAGNTATATSAPVKIDRTPPATTAQAPTGWSTSGAVTLTASDALSGVAATRYRVNGGVVQTGTSLQLPEGANRVELWSEDVAGNIEPSTVITVRVDRSAPTITHAIAPEPNAAGWNNTSATVTFTCDDDVSAIASCSSPSTLANDGAGQTVTGTTADLAGNTAQDIAIVNIDQVAPSITFTRAPAPNEHGWNRTPVTVTYSCSDALSGIASCPVPQIFGAGGGQSAHNAAYDAAGNEATVGGDPINVDMRGPTIEPVLSPAPNSAGWHSGNVTVWWACNDDLSGVQSCPAPTVLTGHGPGQTATATARDRAGNSTTRTVWVDIDRTVPQLIYEGQTPPPNDAGWNRTEVEMVWSCADPESSTTTPAISRRIAAETADTDVTVSCSNRAGLTESDARGPVRIDRTPPTATAFAPGAVPLIVESESEETRSLPDRLHGTSVDALSGTERVVATVVNTVTGAIRTLEADCVEGCEVAGAAQWEISASALGAGTYRVSARGVDVAGNQGADSAQVFVVVVAA